MQQEAAKKSKKWIWLVAGIVALLVVAGVVGAMFLLPGEQAAPEPTGPVGGRPDLYWNIDRELYIGDDNTAGLSKREAGEDGLYHINFAYNGEQVEYAVADKRLVNVIDTYDVIGLVFDENGNVIDAIDPTTFANEVARGFFVMRASATRLELNSSVLMNGMNQMFKLTDLTEIYDVSETADKIGQFGELEVLDKLLIYSNDKDEITHIFIQEKQPKAEIYWRADRFYNSTEAATSRVPDENGVYTIPFAYKGQQVQLQCKDKDLVSYIDKAMIYNAPFGLIFDEEGYIIDTVDPAIALRGMLLCGSYNITEMNGDEITAANIVGGNADETVTFTIDENCEIYNCCIGGSPDFIGQATQLQMMDRILCYTDMDGNPLLIYVMYRMVDSPMYYNITRKYSDANAETTRVPDANGYYVFEMAVQGKQKTFKTKDKAIASRVDSFSYKMMGLKVNGNIIERVYTPYVVCGADGMSPATERFMVDQIGNIVSFVAQGGNYAATTNLVTAANVEIYDVSGYLGTTIGEKTELRKGDKFRTVYDLNKNLTHIYITERYTGYPVYYNLTRYYSAAAGSTRALDAEGYYVFDMVSEGKAVTVKTKDKAIADYIDLQTPNIVALKVNKQGIVTDAAPAQSSIMFGRKAASNGLFDKIENGVMNFTLASTGKTYTTNIADNYKAYNCGQVYDKFRGEKTTLQQGDQMIAIRDDMLGQVTSVYVIQRKVDCELYYNTKAMYSSAKQETTRVPDADGWYIYDLAVNGKVKQFKTKDKTIANFIDSKGSAPFAMTVKGDQIKQAFAVTGKKGLKSFAVSNYDFMDAGDGKCVLKCNIPGNANYGKTLEAKLSPKYKAYDVSSYAENFGEQVKLKVGDRVICYYNDDGEIEWFYIWYRNVREEGAYSKCSHCNKVVYWQPYSITTYTEDAHLYLTHDRACTQVVVGSINAKAEDQPDVVLDLNGHTMSTSVSADRLFVVYGTLSVMDTVGGGKIEARNRNTTTACGGIMVQTPGTFKLYSGTLTGSGADTKITNGGIVFVGAGSAFKMYGGTVTGGKAKNGGNIYVNTNAAFEMYGGTVTGGTATNVGGNVWLGAGTFLMGKGTIDGDVVVTDANAKVTVVGASTIGKGAVTGLQLTNGAKLNLSSKVTAETKITVDAAGVFTDKVSNASTYLQSITPYDSTFPVFVKDGALACGRLAKCEDCGEEVYWSRYSNAACVDGAHLVLTDDMELSSTGFVGKDSKVVVDLNGYTLSTKADRTFSVEGGTLSIQDTVGGGKIVGRSNDKEAAAGAIMAYSGGTLNLYSGEICGSDADAKITNGGVLFIGADSKMNMYGGTVTGTEAALGGAIYGSKGGVINLHGGTITGGTATKGGNIYSEGTVIINKATVSGGVATYGGNICSTSAVRLNDGALVTGGQAANGGNIYITVGTANIQGGTVENGVATPAVTDGTITDGMGGNIYAEGAIVIIGATEGTVKATVTDGRAYRGGNIYSARPADASNRALTVNVNGIVTKGETVAVEGDTTNGKHFGGNIYSKNTAAIKGEVSYGKAHDGGNIYTENWTDIHGTVAGGEALTRGGNIFNVNSTVVFYNGAKITGGKAPKGGNILTTGKIEVQKGAEISGGEATEKGGNIFMAAGGKTLTIAGKVLDGVAPAAGNIAVVNNLPVEVNGGTITGGSIALGDKGMTVSGATVIDSLVLAEGQKITLGELTEGASITLDATGVFTEVNEKAADYAGYFHPITGAPDVQAHAIDNALVLGIRRYCAKCEADVMWDVFTQTACTGTKHLILTDDATVTVQRTIAEGDDITIDLNGHTLTATDVRVALVYGTLTIQDSSAEGDGVVTCTKVSARNGGTLAAAASGVINLYSGTITLDANAQAGSNGGVVSVGDGTFNMFGGLITGGKLGYEKAGQECLGANVYVRGGKFNMAGGVIDGATVNPDNITLLGGNIYAGSGSVVTINGGEIKNGTAQMGGNIYSVGTLILNGGEIVGGTATLGGNIYSLSAVRTNGGKISGGQAANGGNIYVKNGVANLVGGIVENGVATPVVVDGVTTEGKGGNVYAEKARIMVGADSGEVAATVSGGQAYLGGNIYSNGVDAAFEGQAVVIKATGTVTGGQATNGGNIYVATDTLTVKGTVSGGVATPIVNGTTVTEGKGGNIYTDFALLVVNNAEGTTNATVTGGQAYRGGNIYSNKVSTNANKAVTIGAKATVTLGKAVAVEGDAGTSKNIGGNIYSGNTITITGTISDGEADDGGNIYAQNWTGTYAGASITGGKAVRRGGNIFAIGTLELTAGTIENGEAVNGGNIAATGNVSVLAGVTVQNGTATTGKGGNIYMIITGSARKTLTVKGKVLGGSAPAGAGIAATNLTNITVDGGQVTGALQPNDANVQITVSGAPMISNLILPANCKITLGNLKIGTDITVSASGVFTNANDNVETYKAYFKPADRITIVGETLSMG